MKPFINIDRDFVQMNNKGPLHYRGRKDHHVKLHRQHIKFTEIE